MVVCVKDHMAMVTEFLLLLVIFCHDISLGFDKDFREEWFVNAPVNEIY